MSIRSWDAFSKLKEVFHPLFKQNWWNVKKKKKLKYPLRVHSDVITSSYLPVHIWWYTSLVSAQWCIGSCYYFYHDHDYFMVVDWLVLTALCHWPLVVLVMVRLGCYSSSSLLLNIQSQYIPGWEGTSLSIITVMLRLRAEVTSCWSISPSALLQQFRWSCFYTLLLPIGAVLLVLVLWKSHRCWNVFRPIPAKGRLPFQFY